MLTGTSRPAPYLRGLSLTLLVPAKSSSCCSELACQSLENSPCAQTSSLPERRVLLQVCDIQLTISTAHLTLVSHSVNRFNLWSSSLNPKPTTLNRFNLWSACILCTDGDIHAVFQLENELLDGWES